MKKGSTTLTFTYDASGIPLTVTHGSTKYYYATNIQGDVVAILNSNGSEVGTYTYDAWGNCTVTGTASIMQLNPLRYRGYVYDQETGLYYLQSRYYNPEVGRFVNADGYTTTGQGFVGNNMFAYCGNNPVLYSDNSGMRHEISAGGVGIYSPSSNDGLTLPTEAANEPAKESQDNFAPSEPGIDWDNIAKETWSTAIAGATLGIVEGYHNGLTASPFTGGTSVLGCTVAGALIGFAGGGLTGFVGALVKEFWD